MEIFDRVLCPPGNGRDRAGDHGGRIALNDLAQCRKVGPGTRLDHVRGESVTGEDLVAGADPQPHLALGVFTRRDRFDVILLQLAGNRHSGVDGLKERVDGAVPLAVAAHLGSFATDHNAAGSRSRGTDAGVPADELQWVIANFELVTYQRHQVGSGHSLLSIGQDQEAVVRLIDLVLVQADADLQQRIAESGPPRVLAKYEPGSLPADVGWIHDLVRRALLQHPVLVDAGLVGERVRPDDGLVWLDRNAGQGAHEPAGRNQALLANARHAAAELITARRQRHNNLFKRRVACALADSVHGHFNL